jgi:hypothetical protein
MAQASGPTNVSQRMACTEFAFSVYAVTKGRDAGTPRAKMDELNAQSEERHKLPSQAIDDVYRYRNLRPVDLYLYWRWECDARGRNIPIASLGTVADRLGPCLRTSGAREPCLDSIRRVLGLPEDIYPSVSATLESYDRAPKP